MRHIQTIQPNIKVFLAAVLLATGISVFRTATAHAIINNRQGIPDCISSQACTGMDPGLELIPDCGYQYAQYSWVSAFNNPKTQTLFIDQGATAVALKWNVLSAVCNNNITGINGSGQIINESKKETRFNFLRAEVTEGGSPIGTFVQGFPDHLSVFYDACYNNGNDCRYFKDSLTDPSADPVSGGFFVINLPANWSEGWHTVRVQIFSHNVHLTKANTYTCVNPSGSQMDSIDGFKGSNCEEVKPPMFIRIYVKPTDDKPTGNLEGATCTAAGLDMSGWAIDGKNVAFATPFDFYFDADVGPVYDNTVVGDRRGSDLTDAIFPGVSANNKHRIPSLAGEDRPQVTIPMSKLIALGLATGTHQVYAYAHAADSSPFAVDFNGVRSASFTCPAPSHYKLVGSPAGAATCEADTPTLSVAIKNDGDGASPANATLSIKYKIGIGGVEKTVPGTPTATVPSIGPGSTWASAVYTLDESLKAGEQLYISATVSPTSGVTGGAADAGIPPFTALGDGFTSPCGPKVYLPYFQTWASDIWAGGKFGKYDRVNDRDEVDPDVGGCSTGPPSFAPSDKKGDVRSWGRGPKAVTNEINGSFAQYGVFANGEVQVGSDPLKNFFSGAQVKFSKNSPLPGPPGPAFTSTNGVGFTFANNYGSTYGNLGAESCIHDFYGQFKNSLGSIPITTPTVDLANMNDGLYTFSGNLTLYNSPGSDKPWLRHKHITIVGEGNIRLAENVYLTDSGGHLSKAGGPATVRDLIGDIPFLMVIAKGNIYFNSNVDRADGTWIAQPDQSDFKTSQTLYKSTGILDDCVNKDISFPADPTFTSLSAEFYSQCGGKNDADPVHGVDSVDYPNDVKDRIGRITIKGGIYARKLRLRRLAGDVFHTGQDSCFDPNPCDTRNKTHAAERIKISPEIYFALPPSNPLEGTSKYDSVENLPPVL